jgi:hypothetical protein
MREDLPGKEKTMHLNNLLEEHKAEHPLSLKDMVNHSEEVNRKSLLEEMNPLKGKSLPTLNNPGQERKNRRKPLPRMPHQ